MKQKRTEVLIQIFKKNIWIWLSYGLLLVCAILAILTHDKPTLHLQLNQLVGNPYLNNFFYYITYVGDGGLVVFILLAVLLYNTRIGLVTSLSFISATIISNLLKYTLFDDVNRPTYHFNYFDKVNQLNLVEGISTHIHNSFPSGHATQAFAILFCLILCSSSNFMKGFYFIIALMAAFSRVYLSQHWLNDIVAGSLIGTISASFWYVYVFQNKRFNQLNAPLLKLRKINAQ